MPNMPRLTRVILIDDEEIFSRQLAHRFNEWRGRNTGFHLQCYRSINEAAREEPRPDAILLDLKLADSEGMETIRHCKGVYGQTVMVILTEGNGELESLRAGADEFLLKADTVGEAGYHRIVEKLLRAAAMKSADERDFWDKQQRMRDSRARVDAREKRKGHAKGLVFYGIPTGAVLAAAAFLIDHNWISVLPGKADTAEVTVQAGKVEVLGNRMTAVETNMGRVAEVLTQLSADLKKDREEQATRYGELNTKVAVTNAQLDWFMRNVSVPPRPRRGVQP